LNNIEASIISACEENIAIEHIRIDLQERASQILAKLEEQGLGTFYQRPLYVEKYITNSPMQVPGLLEPPPMLQLVYLQLTSNCDLDCQFCKRPDSLFWLGCNSCVRWPTSINGTMRIDDIYHVIDQLITLDVMNIHLSGGNPLLRKDLLHGLIERVRSLSKISVGIIIQTNGLGISSDFLDFAVEQNVGFSFSLFGDNDKAYTRRFGREGIFNEIFTSIEACIERKIPFRVCNFLTPESPSNSSPPNFFPNDGQGPEYIFFTELVKDEAGVYPLRSVQVDHPREDHFEPQYFFSH
jgi:sulfatase maturation enzyme AslB (radical SAM superfamily)